MCDVMIRRKLQSGQPKVRHSWPTLPSPNPSDIYSHNIRNCPPVTTAQLYNLVQNLRIYSESYENNLEGTVQQNFKHWFAGSNDTIGYMRAIELQCYQSMRFLKL